MIATGFNASGVKQYLKLAHPNGRFVFVDVLNFDDVGSGPGHSLLCCEEHLDCPFIFFRVIPLLLTKYQIVFLIGLGFLRQIILKYIVPH